MKVDVSYSFVKNKLMIFVHTTASNDSEKIYEIPVYNFFVNHIKNLQQDTDSGFQFCDYNSDIKRGILEMMKFITSLAKESFKDIQISVELFELVGDVI